VGIRGTGTGRGVGGQPVGIRVDPDDDEGAAALLAPEPRQRRVDRAALAAAAGRGLHVACLLAEDAAPAWRSPTNRTDELWPEPCCCRRLVLGRRGEWGSRRRWSVPAGTQQRDETRRGETPYFYLVSLVSLAALCERA
jgi:hypothetical protein